MKSQSASLRLVLPWLASAVLAVAGGPPKDAAMHMQAAVLPFPDLAKAEILLKDGFAPGASIGCGDYDALDAAVDTANPDTAALLIRYGAKPKPSTFVRAAFVANSDSALRLVRAFLAAGCSENSSDGTGTALHKAVWRRNVELVSLLLSRREIALDEVDIDDRTPLMIATEKGDKQLVEMLLKAGANPAVRNRGGFTAADLSLAKIREQQELENLLHPR